jgi:ferredoxin
MKDLDHYYLEVSKKVPISQLTWKQSKFYKQFANREGLLNSRTISRLLDRSLLWNDENECAPMPLAVKSASNSEAGCVYCNECLRGCSYDFIWRSNHGIEKVLNSDLIHSITGARVISVEKTSGSLSLNYKTEDGEMVCLEGFDHVFLGAGPIESFRIASMSKLTPREAIFKDSNTFLVPFLNFNSFKRNPAKGYALTQAYLRCKSSSGNLLHTQFYVYSNEILEKAKSEIRILRLVPDRVISLVLSRLVFGIIYLDGSDSTGLRVSLSQEGDLYLKKDQGTVSRLYPLRKIIKLFNFSVLWKLRIVPFIPLTRTLDPGAGAHFGSWAPAGIHTDSLGRLQEDFNLHIVDSSVLPSLPPGPITFTIMANAFRIASEATG